jgi:cell division protein FtsZ
LDEPGLQHQAIIKVVGVGGGGTNALNHIIRCGVTGVDFIAANTDVRSLEASPATTRIALGKKLTKGLGAGARPEIGRDAAQESMDEIRSALKGADMVYIAAGMGGGTGTGAAPVIAQVAKRDLGLLTVAVVTRPFSFEGKRRGTMASEGLSALAATVDALIVVPNDRLLAIAPKNTPLTEAFSLADDVLRQAVQGVTDLVVRPGIINVDFADLRTIMSNAGYAVMGIGSGKGENRTIEAVKRALESPLMEVPMRGARGVLMNVTAGPDIGIHEVYEAANYIEEYRVEDAEFKWGFVQDETMGDSVQIVVIATGVRGEAAPGTSGKKFERERERRPHSATPNPSAPSAAPTPGSSVPSAPGPRNRGIELTEVDVRPQGEDLFELNLPGNGDLDRPSIFRRKAEE